MGENRYTDRSRCAREAGWRVGLLAGLLTAALAATAAAAVPSDSCRGWRAEHRDWKARAVRAALGGASEQELDTALFEMLQREAYLTSCDVSVAGAREELIGYRLLNRQPDHYGTALLESLLEQAGFDPTLRSRFGFLRPLAAKPATPSPERSER